VATLKEILRITRKNLRILQEREAKYGRDVPLELANQIGDHEQAVALLEETLAGSQTEAAIKTLQAALRPLLVASNVEAIDLQSIKAEIPPLPFEPETVEIPAGPFIMGSNPGNHIPQEETPAHEVDLPVYHLGLYPVTIAQYAEFIKQTDHAPPKKVGWLGKSPPKNRLDHPVVGVSWYDALAYCAWLSEKSGRAYRLPSEAEWEKAARGTTGQIYPWGDTWDATLCHSSGEQTAAVTTYFKNKSPFGCYDTIGNVWEWTSTLWGANWQESDFAYPYQPDDGREDLAAAESVYRIFRGGSFKDEPNQLRSSARRWYAPSHADKSRGFRVALDR
jgi:formylglycine-generating enzyme required for sulfatase activity